MKLKCFVSTCGAEFNYEDAEPLLLLVGWEVGEDGERRPKMESGEVVFCPKCRAMNGKKWANNRANGLGVF